MIYINRIAREKGLKMVDAEESLVLEVDYRDVLAGQPKSSKECAIVKSAKRTYGVDNAYVFRTSAWLEYDGYLVRYVLPPAVQRQVKAFDRRGLMRPGQYLFRAPKGSDTMESHRVRSAKRPGRHEAKDSGIKRKIVKRAQDVRGLHEPL